MSTLVTTNLKNPSNSGNNLVLEANGSVTFSGGSATTPVINFSGDTDTGIYSPGANQVAIGTGGTGRLFVDASGRVGVGVSSPGQIAAGYATIHVGGTSGGGIRMGTDTTPYGYVAGSSNGVEIGTIGATALSVFTNNQTRVTVTSDGKLGLGTSNPAQLLHIKGSGDAKLLLNSINNASDRGIYFATSTDSEILGYIKQEYSTGKFEISSGSGSYASSINFRTGGTADRVVIDSAGRVGVGTTSPQNLLDIAGSSGRLVLANGNTSNGMKITATNAAYSANGYLAFEGYSSEYGRFDSSGRFGLGTSSPSDPLHISVSGANSANIRLQSGDGRTYNVGSTGSGYGSSGKFIIYDITAGAERFCINSSGNVGVGTASPSTALDVSGELTFSAGGAGWRTAAIKGIDEGGSFRGGMAFYTHPTAGAAGAPTERARIDSSGRFGLGTSSPGYLLDVVSTGASDIRVKSGGAGSAYLRLGTATRDHTIYSDASTGSLAIYDITAAATRLLIDSSGRVGVGTASPGNTFHVNSGAVGTSSKFESTGAGSYLAITNSSGTWSLGATSTSFILENSGGEAFRVDSSRRLLVGTSSSSAEAKFIVQGGSTGSGGGMNLQRSVTTASAGSTIGFINFTNSSNNVGATVIAEGDGTWSAGTSHPTRLAFSTTADGASSPTERMRITSAGNVIIQNEGSLYLASADTTVEEKNSISWRIEDGSEGARISAYREAISNAPHSILFFTRTTGGAFSERARIDSSGRLLVGTSSGSYKFQINAIDSPGFAFDDVGGVISNTFGTGGNLTLRAQTSSLAGGGEIYLGGSSRGDSDVNSVVIKTNNTERMRIDNAGSLIYGTSTSPGADIASGTGFYYQISTGLFYVRSNSSPVAAFNRGATDGTLVELKQDEVIEGTISVSGTTVSYNGAHLSRWSQLPFGAERTEILRGSVLSNINEMCEWGDEDNEQLNRMKVSDVEGDKNVSGVFQAWDDDDDTYTNDFYCAMTGDFIIRIGAGITVERGDLLMSAGDGTAKPQDDDIIRSKTIAKVTSTNVSCTYGDGSYCVPCVLMAC